VRLVSTLPSETKDRVKVVMPPGIPSAAARVSKLTGSARPAKLWRLMPASVSETKQLSVNVPVSAPETAPSYCWQPVMSTSDQQPVTVLALPSDFSATPEPTIPPTYFLPLRVHLA